MVDKTQHLRERLNQTLRKEIHQEITSFYREDSILYMQLLKTARQTEAELWSAKEEAVKGATETDPQVSEMSEVFKDLKEQAQERVEPNPTKKSK